MCMIVECSWEVLNKVGGIYTVITSKAESATKKFSDYVLVGPLFSGHTPDLFVEKAPPEDIKKACSALSEKGIRSVYGTWSIPGTPQVVLLDATHMHADTNLIKGQLWEEFGIDSLHSGWDFDEPLRWAWACGMFIEQIAQQKQVIGHFHEWLAGFGGLYLRMNNVPAGFVFTTHATMLGRTLSANNVVHVYNTDDLRQIDARSEAKRLGVLDKHSCEFACANASDVFTTVSDMTASEAEILLERTADVITYNGISKDDYPADHIRDMQRHTSREKLYDFMTYFFGLNETDSLENSLFFVTSGRYEFRNKGLDVVSAALKRLEEHLISINSPISVYGLYLIPGDARGIRSDILEKKSAYSEIKDIIVKRQGALCRSVVQQAQSAEAVTCSSLFSSSVRQRLRVLASTLHSEKAPFSTHNLGDESNDPIINSFYANGLENVSSSHVRVALLPFYLTGSDGLVDMTYNEFLLGADLGVFASLYEPWGYTPAESICLGVPAVAPDTSGFGQFMSGHAQEGFFLLPRMNRCFEDVVSELTDIFIQYVSLSPSERSRQHIAARKLSEEILWDTFISRYEAAYALARSRLHN